MKIRTYIAAFAFATVSAGLPAATMASDRNAHGEGGLFESNSYGNLEGALGGGSGEGGGGGGGQYSGTHFDNDLDNAGGGGSGEGGGGGGGTSVVNGTRSSGRPVE
jgi:hypothetical protein